MLLVPHVGLLMIEYDPLDISQSQLLARFHALERRIPIGSHAIVPSQEVLLPVCFEHPALQDCLERYVETTRSKAAYLPDNIEYLRRCNGLATRREVFDMILHTEYLAAAVGFLCGTPTFFPMTPMVLRCQKYNPTRVTTPAGTIGLGGSIMSLYSTEQLGGYMMAARTLPMRDVYGTKPGFAPNKPWLLEPFDKVKFFEVSLPEYEMLELQYEMGKYEWKISPSSVDVLDASRAYDDISRSPSFLKFRASQEKALVGQEHVEQVLYQSWWQDDLAAQEKTAGGANGVSKSELLPINAPLAANVWKIDANVGDILVKDELVAVLEAMKMEVKVIVPEALTGMRVVTILKGPKSCTANGEALVLVSKE